MQSYTTCSTRSCGSLQPHCGMVAAFAPPRRWETATCTVGIVIATRPSTSSSTHPHRSDPPMKSHLLLVPMILAMSAAIGAPLRTSSPSSGSTDAQAQAAALLSRPHTIGTSKAHGPVHAPSRALVSADAQASAAALLSRPRTETTANAAVSANEPSRSRMTADAQMQAAALLGS